MLPLKSLAVVTSPWGSVRLSCTKQAWSDDQAPEMGGVTALGSAPSQQRSALCCEGELGLRVQVCHGISNNFLSLGVLVTSSSDKLS